MNVYFDPSVPEHIKKIAVLHNWIPLPDKPACVQIGEQTGVLLTVDDEMFVVKDLDHKAWGTLRIDFLEPQWLRRLKKVQHETQLIKRAVGIRPGQEILIWDATAGLGRDALLLASLGYRVIATERSPIIFELLREAYDRGRQSPDLKEILSRLQFVFGDSKELLPKLRESERPDVIYLDPMYPASKKSAQPRKDMQILRKVLGPDNNLDELFEIAQRTTQRKVILKSSPRTALRFNPKYSIESKSVRFDVYSAAGPVGIKSGQ